MRLSRLVVARTSLSTRNPLVLQRRYLSSDKPSGGASAEILDSIFGSTNSQEAPKTENAQAKNADESQRMKDVDAIFESLFGRSRKKTDLDSLKYFRLYPKPARQWIKDAKTPGGVYDRFGNWEPEKTTNVYRKDQPSLTRDATTGIPHRKELPTDLVGKYRFGITEADLVNAPPKVKDLLSFRWANQKEINDFRAKEGSKPFETSPMDTGSSSVQIVRMTVRIRALTEHMIANHKDKRTKRALTTLVSRRTRMMKYLKKRNVAEYYQVLTALNLRDIA